MIKLLRVGKILSSLFFIAILLYTYAFVVRDVRVFIEPGSMELYRVETLFNATLIAFILFSLLIFVFSKLLDKYLPDTSDIKWLSANFKADFIAWLEGMHIAVNVLFITLVLYVGFINSDKEMNLMNYAFLLYVGPIAVFMAFLSLVWVFVRR